MTKHDTILGNAGIVLADRVIERGWVAFANGRIAEFGEGDAPGPALIHAPQLGSIISAPALAKISR